MNLAAFDGKLNNRTTTLNTSLAADISVATGTAIQISTQLATNVQNTVTAANALVNLYGQQLIGLFNNVYNKLIRNNTNTDEVFNAVQAFNSGVAQIAANLASNIVNINATIATLDALPNNTNAGAELAIQNAIRSLRALLTRYQNNSNTDIANEEALVQAVLQQNSITFPIPTQPTTVTTVTTTPPTPITTVTTA